MAGKKNAKGKKAAAPKEPPPKPAETQPKKSAKKGKKKANKIGKVLLTGTNLSVGKADSSSAKLMNLLTVSEDPPKVETVDPLLTSDNRQDVASVDRVKFMLLLKNCITQAEYQKALMDEAPLPRDAGVEAEWRKPYPVFLGDGTKEVTDSRGIFVTEVSFEATFMNVTKNPITITTSSKFAMEGHPEAVNNRYNITPFTIPANGKKTIRIDYSKVEAANNYHYVPTSNAKTDNVGNVHWYFSMLGFVVVLENNNQQTGEDWDFTKDHEVVQVDLAFVYVATKGTAKDQEIVQAPAFNIAMHGDVSELYNTDALIGVGGNGVKFRGEASNLSAVIPQPFILTKERDDPAAAWEVWLIGPSGQLEKKWNPPAFFQNTLHKTLGTYSFKLSLSMKVAEGDTSYCGSTDVYYIYSVARKGWYLYHAGPIVGSAGNTGFWAVTGEQFYALAAPTCQPGQTVEAKRLNYYLPNNEWTLLHERCVREGRELKFFLDTILNGVTSLLKMGTGRALDRAAEKVKGLHQF